MPKTMRMPVHPYVMLAPEHRLHVSEKTKETFRSSKAIDMSQVGLAGKIGAGAKAVGRRLSLVGQGSHRVLTGMGGAEMPESRPAVETLTPWRLEDPESEAWSLSDGMTIHHHRKQPDIALLDLDITEVCAETDVFEADGFETDELRATHRLG